MAAAKPLIVNSPHDAPARHWEQRRDGTLKLAEGRRNAGYENFDARNNARRAESPDLANAIRARVTACGR